MSGCLTESCEFWFQGKVRDLRYDDRTRRLATLGADGKLIIWDPQLEFIRAVSSWQGVQGFCVVSMHSVL